MEPFSGKTGRSPNLIKAYKQGWLQYPVQRMIDWKLRKGLFQVRVQGMEQLRAALAEDKSSVLFLPNHSSWWDFFMCHVLSINIPIDGYGMTVHENMLKFGFFRRIGAFSMDKSNSASIRASFDYAAELLSEPGRAVWIYPQGKMLCNQVRPLGFQGGLRVLLARAGRLRIVPTAFRYEFWQDERPEAFARFGEPFWVEKSEKKTLIEECERRVTIELDVLCQDVFTQDASKFVSLLQGEQSIHERYSQFKEKFLGKRESNSSH